MECTSPKRRSARKTLVIAADLLTYATASRAESRRWIEIGLAGAVAGALALDLHDPTTLYAGAQESVFRSTLGDGNWTGVYSGLHSLQVPARAIGTIAPAASTSRCDGVFRGIDRGRWEAHVTRVENSSRPGPTFNVFLPIVIR